MSFWRGNVPNVVRNMGATAVTFSFKDKCRDLFLPVVLNIGGRHRWRRRKTLFASFLSGGLAGGLASMCFYPLEYSRTRLALDMGGTTESPRQYPNGMRDVIKQTISVDGVRGLYKGFP